MSDIEPGYARRMRAILLAMFVIAAAPAPARAEIGLGAFIGEPLGIDLKIDLAQRSALDIVGGVTSIRDRGRDYSYGHLTYLVTPYVGRGRSVLVPLRVGIGGAMYGFVEGDVFLAARVPFEIGLRLRRTPLEFYGEIALKLTFVQEYDVDYLDLDGGVGLRIYF